MKAEVTRGRAIELLLVEDSPSDAGLTKAALREVSAPVNVYHVQDGVEAMRFLRREVGYERMPRPDMILLDLNMPRKRWARGPRGDPQ